ncbi:hypothetical protein Ahy_B02g059649 isoform A [Arachis hypogaea]|uniref:RRM domain-containing protein n=1 Tax=Arachis hypogaea TaxID=3818 RepID=A0A445AH13_ARAHY|nr:hypothetical protein Ahy_B02g059649 isoform A [Arachis hypogaea]
MSGGFLVKRCRFGVGGLICPIFKSYMPLDYEGEVFFLSFFTHPKPYPCSQNPSSVIFLFIRSSLPHSSLVSQPTAHHVFRHIQLLYRRRLSAVTTLSSCSSALPLPFVLLLLRLRSVRLKEKNGENNTFSMNNCDDESAARTRPFSFEEIMHRRRNKELLENVKVPFKEAWNKSPRSSTNKIPDHIESMSYKHDRSPPYSRQKHVSEEIITKEKSGKEMAGLSKNGYEDGIKHQRDPVNKDRHAETIKSRSERKTKKNDHTGDFENINEYHFERKHDKSRNGREKSRKHLINDSDKLAEKKHQRDLDKGRHGEGKGKHDREAKRKYQNLDDKSLDRDAMVKQDLGKHHNQWIQERKQRWENVSHHEESTVKRRRSRSQEHDNKRRRRRSPSFSPRSAKHTYHDEERKELPMLSLKDSSRKKHSDVYRDRASTNGSSSHNHRHGASTSGLGGYSPRKRKSEAAAKTPSPSKHSTEKKRAGWDLTPGGADNSPQAFVSSSFQLSNHAMLSNIQSMATSVDPTVVKPLAMILNDVSIGKNAHIDPVQLTQATRPMRRLYLENVPTSVTEKAVMDSFNNLLLSSGVNHIVQAQPCISCILHKDKGQAVVEFLTAEDASSALSFDGSTLFGCSMKIRRPKDYVEVTTGEPERSDDTAFATSDVVIDSPNKIFVGGISSQVSSEMLMEIAGAFGSLKAYHFETGDNIGSHAFLEYVDHSVTIKACAGLNGMKLGGGVLTVVQAMPDALAMENGGKLPSYIIPEHAKPLLRKPTQVLKIKNVFAMESISSLPGMAVEEILEDVRLECARFGTIKSLNVVKHTGEMNSEPKSESEVKNKVDFEEALEDRMCNTNDEEPSFSERATLLESKGSSGMDSYYEKELEDKVDDNCSVGLNDDAFDDKSCLEQCESDVTAKDTGNKSIPSSNTQECAGYLDTPEDGPKSLDNMVANNTGSEAETKTVASIVDPNNSVCVVQESSPKHDEEDDIHDSVFEQGSVLVEFGRTEACCSVAHCLHGRLFDGRTVTVEYVSLNQYRARFNK